jgi:hypothetical protein
MYSSYNGPNRPLSSNEGQKKEFLKKRNCLIIKSNQNFQKILFFVKGPQDEIENLLQDSRTGRKSSKHKIQRNLQLSNLLIEWLEFHGPLRNSFKNRWFLITVNLKSLKKCFRFHDFVSFHFS